MPVVYEDELLEEDESLAAKSSSLAGSNDLDRDEDAAGEIRISRAQEPSRRRSSHLANIKKQDLTGSASSVHSPKHSYK